MPIRQDKVARKLKKMQLAYLQLYEVTGELLQLDHVYWTERLVLRLARRIGSRRLEQLKEALPAAVDHTEARLKENMLEAGVEAALQGHELGHWEKVEGHAGYEARCGKCGMTVYVSGRTLYSMLGE